MTPVHFVVCLQLAFCAQAERMHGTTYQDSRDLELASDEAINQSPADFNSAMLAAVSVKAVKDYDLCSKAEVTCSGDKGLDQVEPLAKGGFGEVWIVHPKKTKQQLILKLPLPGKAAAACKKDPTKPRCLEKMKHFEHVSKTEVDTNKVIQTASKSGGDGFQYLAKLVSEFEVTVPAGAAWPAVTEHVLVQEFAGKPLSSLERSSILDTTGLAQRIICEGLAGLGAIAKANVIHADITPNNVALFDGPKGKHVRIFDFGAGMPVEKSWPEAYKLGVYTPGYGPPEGVFCVMKAYRDALGLLEQGEALHSYDIFQWGVTVVWLLTGRRVTVAKDMEPFASDKGNAPSGDFIFGMASKQYRADQKAKTGKGGGACAKGALELANKAWTKFVKNDVFHMLDETQGEHQIHGTALEGLKTLFFDTESHHGEGLLATEPKHRPMGDVASKKSSFCLGRL